MCGGEDELGGCAAICKRGFELGGDGERGRDSGDDFKGDASFGEEVDLFACAAEDQRVARLEAEDGAARISILSAAACL